MTTLTAIPRHSWVSIAATHWAEVAVSCDPAVAGPVAEWLASGRPLVSRARHAGEDASRHPLGLCLPTSQGRRRVSLTASREAVMAVEAAAPLREVAAILPPLARAMAHDLADAATALGFEARVFGSAAWQWRGGAAHLHPASDLDLLAAPRDDHALTEWLALISRLDATSTMRLDGEIECPSGDGVHWRELARAPREVLAKSADGARLVPIAAIREQFA